jgi:hypothetical protein
MASAITINTPTAGARFDDSMNGYVIISARVACRARSPRQLFSLGARLRYAATRAAEM